MWFNKKFKDMKLKAIQLVLCHPYCPAKLKEKFGKYINNICIYLYAYIHIYMQIILADLNYFFWTIWLLLLHFIFVALAVSSFTFLCFMHLSKYAHCTKKRNVTYRKNYLLKKAPYKVRHHIWIKHWYNELNKKLN